MRNIMFMYSVKSSQKKYIELPTRQFRNLAKISKIIILTEKFVFVNHKLALHDLNAINSIGCY